MIAGLSPTIALTVTLMLCPSVIRTLLGRAMVDRAGGRSSHRGVVPRGGGLALAGGVMAALAITTLAGAGGTSSLVAGPVALLALIGLVDDLVDLGAVTRLGLQVTVSTVFVVALAATRDLAPGWWAIPIAVVAAGWLVGFVNAFNFMDGINGISVVTTVVVGGSLALASHRWDAGVEVAALALVGGSLGFLPFNATNRVFLGDVGSYLLGAALAILAVVGVADGIPPLAAGLPFTLYVGDVAYTLARRARRGEPLMRAHREHVYQRLSNEAGWGHERTTAVVGAGTLALAVAAHAGGGRSTAVAMAAVLAGLLVLAGYLSLPTLALGRAR